jgi:drug/metabolite transporter (DMT)-like permease
MPVIVLFISSIGWGLTWLPLKYLSGLGMEGLQLVLIAFGAAAIVLMPLSYRQLNKWQGNYRFLMLIALFGGFANLSFQTAIYHGDVIRVMILFYLLPVWSVLGGRIFLGEHIDHKRMLAVAAALLGAFFILGGPKIFNSQPHWIDLLAIASGLSFALNNIVFRYSEQLPLTGKVNAVFLGCALLVLAYLLVSKDVSSILSTDNILLTVAYGIFWIMLITFGTQWGVEQLEAGRASIIIIMELVAAVLSAAIILGETLEGMELIGGLMILAAALTETFRADPDNDPVPGIANGSKVKIQ